MSSILKVDQLQDSGGNNLVTSNGSGVITAAGFGKVGQVVTNTSSTDVEVTGNTFTDSGLSGSITPSSTNSKILILIQQSVYIRRPSSAYAYGGSRLLRGSTNIYNPNPEDGSGSYGLGFGVNGQSGSYNFYGNINYTYLDSPSTTSATTYKTQIRAYTGTGLISAQETGGGTNNGQSVITLMEILP